MSTSCCRGLFAGSGKSLFGRTKAIVRDKRKARMVFMVDKDRISATTKTPKFYYADRCSYGCMLF